MEYTTLQDLLAYDQSKSDDNNWMKSAADFIFDDKNQSDDRISVIEKFEEMTGEEILGDGPFTNNDAINAFKLWWDNEMGNDINEGKDGTITLDDIIKAWDECYGEDLRKKYKGLYDVLKSARKLTPELVALDWQNIYGEDLKKEYEGFWRAMNSVTLSESATIECTKVDPKVVKQGVDAGYTEVVVTGSDNKVCLKKGNEIHSTYPFAAKSEVVDMVKKLKTGKLNETKPENKIDWNKYITKGKSGLFKCDFKNHVIWSKKDESKEEFIKRIKKTIVKTWDSTIFDDVSESKQLSDLKPFAGDKDFENVYHVEGNKNRMFGKDKKAIYLDIEPHNQEITGEYKEKLFDKIKAKKDEIFKIFPGSRVIVVNDIVKIFESKIRKMDENGDDEMTIELEYAIPVKDIVDEIDDDDLRSDKMLKRIKKEINQNIATYSEEMRNAASRIKIEVIDFCECDSGNISHASAYYNIKMTGVKKDLMLIANFDGTDFSYDWESSDENLPLFENFANEIFTKRNTDQFNDFINRLVQVGIITKDQGETLKAETDTNNVIDDYTLIGRIQDAAEKSGIILDFDSLLDKGKEWGYQIDESKDQHKNFNPGDEVEIIGLDNELDGKTGKVINSQPAILKELGYKVTGVGSGADPKHFVKFTQGFVYVEKEKADETKNNNTKLPEKGTPEWHKIQIAKKTLKMNDFMAGMMGGMTKEEARETLKKYGIKTNEEIQNDKQEFPTSQNSMIRKIVIWQNGSHDEIVNNSSYKEKVENEPKTWTVDNLADGILHNIIDNTKMNEISNEEYLEGLDGMDIGIIANGSGVVNMYSYEYENNKMILKNKRPMVCEARQLPMEYKHSGMTFVQQKRCEKAAIYKEKSDDIWEVFKIKIRKATKIKDQEIPEREVVPGDDAFGDWAWSYSNKDQAKDKYGKLCDGPKSPVNERSDKFAVDKFVKGHINNPVSAWVDDSDKMKGRIAIFILDEVTNRKYQHILYYDNNTDTEYLSVQIFDIAGHTVAVRYGMPDTVWYSEDDIDFFKSALSYEYENDIVIIRGEDRFTIEEANDLLNDDGYGLTPSQFDTVLADLGNNVENGSLEYSAVLSYVEANFDNIIRNGVLSEKVDNKTKMLTALDDGGRISRARTAGTYPVYDKNDDFVTYVGIQVVHDMVGKEIDVDPSDPQNYYIKKA